MSSSVRSTSPAGQIVLSFFGAVWAIIGLAYQGASRVGWLIPAAIAGGLIVAVLRRSRNVAPPPPDEAKRIGRLVAIWSSVEGLGIFIAAIICPNIQRPDLAVAAICLIVGLHFLPLARGVPARHYYLTGGLLSALGIAGLVASGVFVPQDVAFGAASILWGTLVWLLL